MFVRPSKFRHVFGCPFKKEACYEGLKATKSAHDTNFCAVNPYFVAVVVESSGGGSFVVLPIEKTGRVEINTPKVCGHRASITDLKWCPHNDFLIASSSDDATIKIWSIPDEGPFHNITEPVVDLCNGHHKRVSYIEWHPCAQDVLLSAGADHVCMVWDARDGGILNQINIHPDMIFSISWNFDGSLFVTTCKDKVIRIIEPRSGHVVAEGAGHQGNKASKAVFLNGTQVFTTGFSRSSERQYALWDYMNLTKPIKMEEIDSSCGTVIPFFDSDLNIVYLAGKGDGNIRYVEIIDQSPFVYFLNQFQSSIPQRGLGMMPKRGLDLKKCEIARFYKLHSTKDICEPISMIVPRKSDCIQTDIYPPTASLQPSLTADEWMSGVNKPPNLIKLEDGSLTSGNHRMQPRNLQPVSENSHPARSRSLHRDNPSVTRNNTFTATTSTQAECYNSASDLAAKTSLRKFHGLRRKRRTRTTIGLDDEPRSSPSSYDDEDTDTRRSYEKDDGRKADPYNVPANRFSNESTESPASHVDPSPPREKPVTTMLTTTNTEESFPNDTTTSEDFKVQNVLMVSSRCELPDDDSDRHGSRAMLDCISVDAPDDGVILPSKLRASMTSRHRRVERGRAVGSSFAKQDERPPNSELQGLIRAGSVREKSRNYNSIIGRDIFRKPESAVQPNTENKDNNNQASLRSSHQDNVQAAQTSISSNFDATDVPVKIEERSGNVQQQPQFKPSLGKTFSLDQNTRTTPVKAATARVLPISNNSSIKKPGRSLSDFKSNGAKNCVQSSGEQNGVKSTIDRRSNYGERRTIEKSQDEINPKPSNNHQTITAPSDSKKPPPKQAISMSHTELLQEYLKQQQEIKRLKSQLEQRDARVRKLEEELSKGRNRRMI